MTKLNLEWRNGNGGRGETWPLHDIAIANTVWCMAYKRRGRWGGVYCAIVVQWYCNRVGFAGGGGG